MEFQEVICYTKDFEQNTTTELKKNKPISTIKGAALIELFDADTGNKLKESYTENCINNYAGQVIFLENFLYRLFNNQIVNSFGGNIGNKYRSIPFQKLILTDYTGAEDPATRYIKGTLVGFADKDNTYAGTSSTQGSVNLSETSLTYDLQNGKIKLHFVFDFPTNAANGTFQTIWWGLTENIRNFCRLTEIYPSKYCNDSNNTISNLPLYYYLRNSADMMTIDVGTGILWLKQNVYETVSSVNQTSYYMRKLYADSGTIADTTPIRLAKADGTPYSTDNLGINRIGVDNNYLYTVVWGWISGTNQVQVTRFNKDGTFVAQYSLLYTLFNDAGGRSVNVVDCYFSDGTLYIAVYYVVNGKNMAYMININSAFTGVSTSTAVTQPKEYTGTDYYFNFLGKTKSCWMLGCKGDNSNNVTVFDSNFNEISYGCSFANTPEIGCYVFSNWTVCSSASEAMYAILSLSNTYYYGLWGLQPPGAQTLLATPVTKTSTNTMKIQYDFVIDNLALAFM
jgi:hypothetical protein